MAGGSRPHAGSGGGDGPDDDYVDEDASGEEVSDENFSEDEDEDEYEEEQPSAKRKGKGKARAKARATPPARPTTASPRPAARTTPEVDNDVRTILAQALGSPRQVPPVPVVSAPAPASTITSYMSGPSGFGSAIGRLFAVATGLTRMATTGPAITTTTSGPANTTTTSGPANTTTTSGPANTTATPGPTTTSTATQTTGQGAGGGDGDDDADPALNRPPPEATAGQIVGGPNGECAHTPPSLMGRHSSYP